MDRGTLGRALERWSAQSPDLFCAIGFDDRLKLANPAFERFFGKPLAELVHQPAKELVPEFDKDRPHSVQQAKAMRRDGSERCVEWVATTVREDQMIYCLGRDITERKRVEDLVAEASTDITSRIDLEGNAIDYTGQTEKLLGYTREELVGQNRFARIHPDDLAKVHGAVQRLIQGGMFSVEYRTMRKDGEYIWVETSGRAVRDAATQQPAEIIAVTRDISDRKRAEEKHRLLEQQLNQAQKMEAIGRLAGGIAHDFNNLLSAILGFTIVALETLPPGAQERASLEEVTKAGHRAADLVKQLLLFSRRQTTGPDAIIDVNEAIRDLDKMTRRLIGEHVDIVLGLGAEPAAVRLDASQLSQVLINLCANARDAMPRGGRVTIETKTIPASAVEPPPDVARAKHGWVVVSVGDEGEGMSEEARAHAFEPFFTTKPHGTGLGLAAVYGVVRGANGFVELSSELGRGTHFHLFFPLTDLPTFLEDVPFEPSVRSEGQTILVVEDEELVRSVVCKVLERQTYRVLLAKNGKEALAILEETPAIDLLLTDVVMPVMGGTELIERVFEQWPGLRVLLMSGYAADVATDHRVCMLQKPFTPSELCAAVRALLEAKSAPV